MGELQRKVYGVGTRRLQVMAYVGERPHLQITDAPGDTGVVVYLNEVQHLIDVLATAGSGLAGEMVGDPPVERWVGSRLGGV